MELVAENEVSARFMLCERVADFIRRRQLCIPYGGTVNRTQDGKQRAYYSVAFSLPQILDGSVGVYSEKFLLVKYNTKLKYLSARGRMVFKKESDLLEFLDAAFIKFDEARTLRTLEKST